MSRAKKRSGISRKKMQKLFDLLKRIEEQKLRLTTRDLEQLVITETGYAQETWHTYRGKYLDEALIFPDVDDPVLLCVRGACAMAPDRFADLMTQTKRHASPPVGNEDSWRQQIRSLVLIGRERNYMLATEDRALILALFDRQRSLF